MDVYSAYFDDFDIINLNVIKSYYNGDIKQFWLKSKQNRLFETEIISRIDHNTYVEYKLRFTHKLTIGNIYYLVDEHNFTRAIQYRFIVQQPRFDEMFFYSKEDLGANYHADYTLFKLWAPTSNEVILKLKGKYYPMKRGSKGVYSIKLLGDYDGAYYSYIIGVAGEFHKTVDPYSKSSSINSSRSVVINPRKAVVKHNNRFLLPCDKINETFIYELNVRDYTTKGKYDSLIQKGKYLKELGISHIQLMPIYDFGTIDEEHPKKFYNWGYDPMHYFAFEGSYSSNPYNPYSRLIEVKKLVADFHKIGLRVNMDVVFNHVFDYDNSYFNKTVPCYFFRYDADGKLISHSGCQNDVRSEGKMTQKYILSCCKYLVKEIGIDGFRFDLMGLLDVDTMNLLELELRKLNNDIMIYGEAWNMDDRENASSFKNAKKMPNISYFNDYFRDNVIGLIGGDVSKSYFCKEVIKGQHGNDLVNPLQSINYIECHDGLTIFDNMSNRRKDNIELSIQTGLAFCVLSQGIPFFHMGQEFHNSKKGVSNSYCSSDAINKIDWKNRDKNAETVELLKKLFLFRKSHRYFFSSSIMEVNHNIKTRDNRGVVFYRYDDKCFVIFNCTPYDYVLDNEHGEVVLSNDLEVANKTSLQLSPMCFAIMER